MQRRDFLVRTGLAFSAAAFAPTALASNPPLPAASRFDDWQDIRDQFLLTPDLIHMAGFYLASHPKPVRDAIERHRKALDENPFEAHHLHVGEREIAVLQAAAAYLGVQPVDIALTDSTTMGLGTVYTSLDLKPDQEVLQTTHDHYSTNNSLHINTLRNGAKVRQIPLYDRGGDASESEIIDRLTRAITPATRYLAITWVHSSTGVKLPVRAIADALANINKSRDDQTRIVLCVDGVHGIGIEDVTLPSLGCDFFIAGAHKWLFGPRGTGFVWARPEAWECVAPTIPPFSAAAFDPKFAEVLKIDPKRELTGLSMTPGGFHSFEHRWALAEAFKFHQQIGKPRVAERIHTLNTQLKSGLAKMPHITLHTPMSESLSAGIVCFEAAGLTPGQVVDRLRQKHILASVTPYSVKYARLAPSLLTSTADVETTLREVKALG